MIDALHRRAFAYHVVFDVYIGEQTLVLSLQPLEVARVFDSYSRDAGDRGDELQVVAVELIAGLSSVEIKHAQLATEHDQRHAHNGMRPRGDQALRGQRWIDCRVTGQ